MPDASEVSRRNRSFNDDHLDCEKINDVISFAMDNVKVSAVKIIIIFNLMGDPQ